MCRTHNTILFANIGKALMGCRENRVPLAQTLSGGDHFATHVWSVLMSSCRRLLAMSMVGEQTGKGLAESASSAAWTRPIVMHRAAPATPAELDDWRTV